MTQMSLSMKQKQSYRHTEETGGCGAGGRGRCMREEWSGRLGLVDTSFYI